MEEYSDLLKAFDEYSKAKEKLFKFYGSTNMRFDGEYYTYSCEDCGADLFTYDKSYPSLPLYPLFHCGKIRLGNIF